MKNLLLLLLFLVLSFSSSFSQSFVSDRIPIGDKNRKYNFCVVKLDKILNTNTNTESSFDEMINDLKQYRIVMVGESHTNQLHHDVEYEVIKGLTEAGKPVVLALEMFNPSQNEALAAWSSGNTDPNTFLKQTDFLTTWSHNYRYYKAIFNYAREKHLPIYGANVERKYASKIGRGGLGSLTEDDIKSIPHIDTSTIEHKFLIKVLMQGMDATMPKQFNNMYAAQSLWDAAMGEGAIKAANKHPEATVVVLAGSGHVIYNLGIGRIIKDRSNLSFASVVAVDIPGKVKETGMIKVSKNLKKEVDKNKKPEMKHDKFSHRKITDTTKVKQNSPNPHLMSMMTDNSTYRIVIRSYADFLWGKKEMKHAKYPEFGFSVKDEPENGGFQIKRVLPGTIAFYNGLRKGDIILSINRKSFANSFELKKYLEYKNWDDRLSFRVKRNNKNKDITFIIKPIKESEE